MSVTVRHISGRSGLWSQFVLILFAVSACTTWGTHAVETSTPQTGRLQGHFRVTVRDGSRVEMKDVLISGDSISGLRSGWRETQVAESVAVPRSQVIAFQRQSFSIIRSGYLLIALAACVVVAFAVAFSQAGDNY